MRHDEAVWFLVVDVEPVNWFQGRIKGGTGGPGPRAPHIKGPPHKKGKREEKEKKERKKEEKERKKEKEKGEKERKEKKKGKKKREKREVKKKEKRRHKYRALFRRLFSAKEPHRGMGAPGQTGSRCLSKPIFTGHHLNVFRQNKKEAFLRANTGTK